MNFKADGGAMFGVVPKSIWSKFAPSDENNLITLSLRSLLIKLRDRIILIDTGIGEKQDPLFLKFLYMSGGEGLLHGLHTRGIKAEDITDVVLTHLHFDHCGGSLYIDDQGQSQPTFPNAKYWINSQQWENSMNPNPREADAFLPENLLPLNQKNLISWLDEEGEWLPGIHMRIVQGHTPGQLLPVIKRGKHTVFYGADLIPTHGHIPVKYNMAYDTEVLKTMEEKEEILSECLEENGYILFEHDPVFEGATIKKTRKGFRPDRLITVKEYLNLSV